MKERKNKKIYNNIKLSRDIHINTIKYYSHTYEFFHTCIAIESKSSKV